MKKLQFLILLALLPMFGFVPQDHYTIRGTGEDIKDGDTIYLCEIQGFFSIIKLDSTTVTNGEYCFTGSYEGCDIRYVMPCQNGKYTNFISIMLENADISLHSFSDKKREAEKTGGENYKLWQEFKKLQSKRNDLTLPYIVIINDTTSSMDEKLHAQHVVDSIKVIQRTEENQFMLEHLPAPFCDLILGSNYKSLTPNQQKEVMAAFGDKYPNSRNYKKISSEMKDAKTLPVGQQFIDFNMPDPEGKTLSISEIVNKNRLTLVDFWASWCGPCRMEMPNVVEAYNRYHQKGFEVIGVSLDTKHDAWIKGIESFQMPWPQISDLKGWQSNGAKLYNVRAIPANVLINNKGEIVARDLRGLTLINKIGEFLKK